MGHRYEILGLSVFEEAGPGTGKRHGLGLSVSEKTVPVMVRSCDQSQHLARGGLGPGPLSCT